MDIRIPGCRRFALETSLRRRILAVFLIAMILGEATGSPVWMPQFLSGGQGRSIRHLPCVSRRTGEQGICMFAYTCLKSNGTHLGTCIDRFYFGSCCKLDDANELFIEGHFPAVSNNQVISSGGGFDHYGHFPSTSVDEKPTQKVEASTPLVVSTVGHTTDRTVADPTQHLATEIHFPTTDKFYIPVHTAKPNRTGVVSSGPNQSTVAVPSSSAYGGVKRPAIGEQNAGNVTEPAKSTTPSYLLSTFQVVHNEGDLTTTSKLPSKPVTVSPQASASVPSWTPVKETTTTPVTIKRNTTVSARPTTTTKKPAKPVKPYTTTRKPATKRPVAKPTPVKVTTPKPTQPVKVTTTGKPTQPVKKPTQPTKKPSTQKPTSRPTVKPTVVTTTTQRAKPSTTVATTPAPATTSEVVFTRPGPTPGHVSSSGITTFRPDIELTTYKPAIMTGSGLTTFSYVSEGVKVTTIPPTEPPKTTTPATTTTTNKPPISVGFPSQPGSSGYQPVVVTMRPATSPKPVQSTVPFFPDAGKPQPPTWIEMMQATTTTKSEAPVTATPTTTTTTTTTTAIPAVDPAVLAMFEGLNHTDYNQVCGRRIYPQARVVGGEKSAFGKWPWQISLRQWRTSTYLHKCGAALLNENWAITAAHCVENVPPSDLLLRLGEHDLSTEDEPFGFQERRVQIVASHPQFDPRTFEYDLALLRFYEPVKFQPNIIPVCVPEDNTNFVGQTAYVTGWGRLYEDGPLPSVLQEVSVPVINNTLCENMYRSAGYIEHIPEIFICAGWKKGGFDSCEGDSGGPMVIQRPDKRWLLAGVISWGIGCAEPNQPGVYTRISEFRDWIHQILQF